MEYLLEIKDLDKLPDAQIVERKVVDGQRVAFLFAIGPLARKMSGNTQADVIVKLVPMGYIDTVETMLEAEGYSVSRA